MNRLREHIRTLLGRNDYSEIENCIKKQCEKWLSFNSDNSNTETINVKKKVLKDGMRYDGNAMIDSKGVVIPHGFGTKWKGDLFICANWEKGIINGIGYIRFNRAFILGHFVNGQPNGWCFAISNTKDFYINDTYDFGIFKGCHCVLSFKQDIKWLCLRLVSVEVLEWLGMRSNSKKKILFWGIADEKEWIGFHVMNNGDFYVGNDAGSHEKNGHFIKYTTSGIRQVGLFDRGNIVEYGDLGTLIEECHAEDFPIPLYPKLKNESVVLKGNDI